MVAVGQCIIWRLKIRGHKLQGSETMSINRDHVFCSIVLCKVAGITAAAKRFASGQGQQPWQCCCRTKDGTRQCWVIMSASHLIDLSSCLIDVCTLPSRESTAAIGVPVRGKLDDGAFPTENYSIVQHNKPSLFNILTNTIVRTPAKS